MITISDTEYFLKAVLFGLKLRLFSNDVVPGKNDVIGDYTEVKGAGYKAIPLDINSLQFKNNYVVIDKEFEINSESVVYGYYLTVGKNLFGVERFSDGPYEIGLAGGKIHIKSTMYLMTR